MKIIKDNCYKGTRIVIGNEKRQYLSWAADLLISQRFNEIQIPNIQFRETFKGKVGIENTSMMFAVKDNNLDRDLVLAPEYTAVVQNLAKTYFKFEKDVKLFYILECYRGENPQAGRYRQFTQLGVEILNPTKTWALSEMAEDLIRIKRSDYSVNFNVSRGLDYYKNGRGFEIVCEALGSSKQVCGGGEYDGGVGFAIGVDRIIF